MFRDTHGRSGGFFGGEPMQPFLWGSGGRRMSSDDLALERRLAAQQMATGADFSPIASPWQGLARVATGALGGLRMREANETAAEQDAARAAVLEALSGGGTLEGGGDSVAAALLDPELRDIGAAVLKSRQPKQYEPPEVIQLSRIANDPTRPEWERRAAADAVAAKNDPMVTVTLPGGGLFVGPQSELATAMGAGEQQASYPPPPPEAVQQLLQNPDTAAQYDEIFGPGAAAEVFAARQGFREAAGR